MQMSDQSLCKKCLVCGDQAIGNNFDALSCESCKAFFRRNAVKNKEFKCHFENKCKIDVKTRRFCKKCRLKKCIQIGMKRDWILSDEEKKVRKTKIESNRKCRKISVFTNSESSSSADNCNSAENSTTLEIPDTFGLYLDEISSDIHTVENVNDHNNKISNYVYQKAVELEFSMLPISRPITDHRHTFNELEGHKLTELLSTTSIMKTSSVMFTSKANNLLDVCKVMGVKCEQDIRKIIKMSKQLTAFNSITESDKLVLIKYSCLGLFCMRSVQTFDCHNQYLTFSWDNGHSFIVNMDLMRELPRNFHYIYLNFLRKINKEWDSDYMILDLLTAIALFNPDIPHLMHKELVKLQQQIYMYLLQRYLRIKYQSESESKLKFLRLLSILFDMTIVDRIYSKNCYEKEPEYCPPLVKEISSK